MSPAAAAIVARSTLRAARRMLQLLLMHSICKHTNRCVYSIKTSAGQRFCGERLANCHCNFHCNVLGQMANNGSFGWWVLVRLSAVDKQFRWDYVHRGNLCSSTPGIHGLFIYNKPNSCLLSKQPCEVLCGMHWAKWINKCLAWFIYSVSEYLKHSFTRLIDGFVKSWGLIILKSCWNLEHTWY